MIKVSLNRRSNVAEPTLSMFTFNELHIMLFIGFVNDQLYSSKHLHFKEKPITFHFTKHFTNQRSWKFGFKSVIFTFITTGLSLSSVVFRPLFKCDQKSPKKCPTVLGMQKRPHYIIYQLNFGDCTEQSSSSMDVIMRLIWKCICENQQWLSVFVKKKKM